MSVPRLTTEQAIILSAFTGKLLCNFSDLQLAVEQRLGRPVYTHEFGDAAFAERIREEYREDALAIVPETAL
jgi:hypothetical protein